MAQNAFVQSMKTIADSLIRKAGFDKTRSGKVVGVNSLTNTYSVKVDGYTYNNVRVVNDSKYNVGDTVKVNMPVNQPSQMYISASIFSDSSIGRKIAHAETLIEAADREISDIIEIMGNIYQLSIRSEYTSTSVTHYGVMIQNGEDVTAPEYTQNFKWYLEKPTGKELQGAGASLTLNTSEFLYGQAILLEWVVDNTVKLRARVTLFDNSKVEEIRDRVEEAVEIATNEQQYYWFTDEGTDTGAHISFLPKDTFESRPAGGNLLANARGVAIRHGLEELVGMQVDPNNTNNSSIYFNGYVNNTWQKIAEYKSSGIWFHDSIPYTIGNTNSYIKYEYDSNAGKYKINISADSITLGNQNVTSWEELGSPYLTEITNGGLFVHRADSGYNATNPASSQAYGIKIASTMEFIQAGKALATYGDTITFRNTSGYTMMQLSAGSLAFYRGTSSSNYALATFGTGSITLKNTSGVNTFVAQASGMTLYNGNSSTNVALASFSTSGLTLKNNSGYTTFTVGSNTMVMYTGTSTNYALATFGTGGMTLKNSSGYNTLVTSASALTIYSGNSSNIQIASLSGSGMTLKNSSGSTLCTVGGSGASFNNSSGTTLCNISTSGMTIYNSSGYQLANFGSTATIGQTSSYNMYFTSGTLNFRYGGTTAGYINANTSGTYMTIKSNGKAVYSSTGDMQINSQSTTDATNSGTGSLVIWAGGGLGLLSSAAGLVFRNTTSSGGYGIIRPMGDQSDIFGTTSNRWWKVYTYGVDTGSDRKLKDITGNISFAKDFIMSLRPVEFMWKNGDHRRTRMGFIAQEVAEWAKSRNLNLSVYSASFKDDDDMTAYYGEDVDDEKLIWSMEYEQLIAPAIKVIQDQQHTIEDLTQRIEALEDK